MRTTAFTAGSDMELAGLEPATSWVRYRPNDLVWHRFDFIERRSLLSCHVTFAQFGSTGGRSVRADPARAAPTAILRRDVAHRACLGACLAVRFASANACHGLARSAS